MINLPLSDVRIFLCATPIKMCYGIDTLMGLAQTVFDQDPLSGHLFLFFNRERNRVKILFWPPSAPAALSDCAVLPRRSTTLQLILPPRSASSSAGLTPMTHRAVGSVALDLPLCSKVLPLPAV